ncbi:Histone acetyltransferase HAC1 [Abeliophyllum distichum]|uniref:histone acetyltransferase n=1 Tax=Abeliophyllum distichum TaxID=126358 RepID=A0ABD1PQT6_9LAMI
MKHSTSEKSCQLCGLEKLMFEPPPIYCTPCAARIKRNSVYYTATPPDRQYCFCIPCYNDACGDTIVVYGTSIPKAGMKEKENNEETEEPWVQCDKCEAWQHQICALFDCRKNNGGQAEYTCPKCYAAQVGRGERVPSLQSAVLGAKYLPKTILSDHIEQRLFRKLKLERQLRARLQRKDYDEVPGAESLIVRLISSLDKKMEIKPGLHEILQEENYPSEFPYKSKVLFLFQKIEGVEVCHFGMNLQEFGSECQQPNQRRVYISYLDSVKYFRPDVKAVTGESLRTFVYHEILANWIFRILQISRVHKLLHMGMSTIERYLSMLRKAAMKNIVVAVTNLYDHFFVSSGECKAKVTAARLPYFDGDYWPFAAEDMIYQLQQEEDEKEWHKKGTIEKTITERAIKASGQSDLSVNAAKDLLLMHKLGEMIRPMKEDFIMVHLQHACTHCCNVMVSGNSWVCKQCRNFQLCDDCYKAEQQREDGERHPMNQKEKHLLHAVEITDVPGDTKDKDEILEFEFFRSTEHILLFCQENHYQFDTFRRAKYSSMMILCHLHNLTPRALTLTCYICHRAIRVSQCWRCETCPDYDVCNTCYQKDGRIDHPHNFYNTFNDNKKALQLGVMQLRKMLDLLVNASQCYMDCEYPNCGKLKALFRHGKRCDIRAPGGCFPCQKMWYLLSLHARECKKSDCSVPRCRDVKEYGRWQRQILDSQRKVVVMEMMRQRTAQVA